VPHILAASAASSFLGNSLRDTLTVAVAVAVTFVGGLGTGLTSYLSSHRSARELDEAGGFVLRRVLAETAEKPPETLEQRLGRLSKLMADSAVLTEEVSAELEARAAAAEQLQKQADDAVALAAVKKEEADAIRRMVDAGIAARLAENREAIEAEISARLREQGELIRKGVKKDSIRIGVLSFIFGGGLTFVITLLVRPLH
jgi:hypothetical protein